MGEDGSTAAAPLDLAKKKADADNTPDLAGYGSREWLRAFIANPAQVRFYNENNDRMPAFAKNANTDDGNILTREEIELLVAWLRGEDSLEKHH